MMLMIFLKELEAVITSVIQPEGIGETIITAIQDILCSLTTGVGQLSKEKGHPQIFIQQDQLDNKIN